MKLQISDFRFQIGFQIGLSHRLSPRSANFWALCFDVPQDQIAALRPR